MKLRLFQILLGCWLLASPGSADPVVYPYLQNLSKESVELLWVDTDPTPVIVKWLDREALSQSRPAPELDFHPVEKSEFPEAKTAPPRYLHQVTLKALAGHRSVDYVVDFPSQAFEEQFRPLAGPGDSVRLIAYADSETEPESTGKRAKWGTAEEPKRKYLVDQSTGYTENLKLIRERQPDAILIAGDLVESGGEQRDWDEFWKHNRVLAGSIPLLPAPGNHDYYAGPRHGKYERDASLWAISKYRSYFSPGKEEHSSQYYSKEIGRVTLISLDSNDGLPHQSDQDSNHYLEAAGDFAPGFHPESPQTLWLEEQLRVAQEKDQFTIVMFHHCPYSSGPHGFEPGSGEGLDEQSGQALRSLTPLFLKYGVELLITGHDEMMERSKVTGQEILPSGQKRETTLLVYDVGIGGDGLRGPRRVNEFKEFLASDDAPEQWTDGVLQEGGRHYGHLEIDLEPKEDGWHVTISPVYLLPFQQDGQWLFQRHVYKDIVTLP